MGWIQAIVKRIEKMERRKKWKEKLPPRMRRRQRRRKRMCWTMKTSRSGCNREAKQSKNSTRRIKARDQKGDKKKRTKIDGKTRQIRIFKHC